MGNIRAISTQVPIIKAFTGAATLALLGVLAIGVSGASAQAGMHVGDGDDDAYGEAICMVTGAAGVANTPVDGIAHDRADDDEAWDRENEMDTDGGYFDFDSSTVVCSGEDEGGEVIGAFASEQLTIVAGTTSRLGEGEYTNLVLPTGHAEGSADLCGPAWVAVPGGPCVAGAAGGPPPSGGNETNLLTRFSIPFVAGQGPLAISSFDGVVDLTAPVVPDDDPLDGDAPLPLVPCPAPAPPPPGPGNQEDLDDVADCVDHLQDIDTGHGVGVVSITSSPDGMVAEPGNPDCNTDPDAPEDGYNSADCESAPANPDPTPDNDPGGQGVNSFEVAAAFTATLSGDSDTGQNENDDGPDPNGPINNDP